jgi:hypothetical protein
MAIETPAALASALWSWPLAAPAAAMAIDVNATIIVIFMLTPFRSSVARGGKSGQYTSARLCKERRPGRLTWIKGAVPRAR